MKRIQVKITITLALVMMMTACIGDLDVVPLDPSIKTSNVVYKTTDDYKQGLAKLYASYAVSGQRGPDGLPDIAGIREDFGNYLRQYWNAQQLSTDESIMAWADA